MTDIYITSRENQATDRTLSNNYGWLFYLGYWKSSRFTPIYVEGNILGYRVMKPFLQQVAVLSCWNGVTCRQQYSGSLKFKELNKERSEVWCEIFCVCSHPRPKWGGELYFYIFRQQKQRLDISLGIKIIQTLNVTLNKVFSIWVFLWFFFVIYLSTLHCF